MAIDIQKEVCSICGKLFPANETKNIQIVFDGGNVMLFTCPDCHQMVINDAKLKESTRLAKIEDINKVLHEQLENSSMPDPISEDDEITGDGSGDALPEIKDEQPPLLDADGNPLAPVTDETGTCDGDAQTTESGSAE